MDRQQMIEGTLFTSSYPNILKRTNVTSLIISLSILLIGGAILFSSFLLNVKLYIVSMILMIIGIILLLIATFRLFWRTKEMVYVPTLSLVKESTLFYDSALSDRIVEVLHSADFTLGNVIKSSSKGTVRLDVLMSEDAKFVALQLFQCVSYRYLPVSPVFHASGNEAMRMADYLAESKNRCHDAC